jgi:hypothetical protein
MTTSACPSETILVAYAEGRSAIEERTLVEAHMTTCADCRTIVSMLVKDDGRSTTDPFARTLAVDASPESAPPSSDHFSPGEMFEEKYRVEKMIGAGGMGVVAEATHLGLGRRVAIKFMRAESRSNPEGAVRFLREARACANLSSEHVVRVFDNGMSKNGDPYLVMELLRGEDLAELLKREKIVEPSRAARWVIEACDAIGEAHELGVVHRDLKPANLFLAEGKNGEKKIKVLDFGISKLIGEGSFGGLVGARVSAGAASRLFRRHVTRRAEHRALRVVPVMSSNKTTPSAQISVRCRERGRARRSDHDANRAAFARASPRRVTRSRKNRDALSGKKSRGSFRFDRIAHDGARFVFVARNVASTTATLALDSGGSRARGCGCVHRSRDAPPPDARSGCRIVASRRVVSRNSCRDECADDFRFTDRNDIGNGIRVGGSFGLRKISGAKIACACKSWIANPAKIKPL